MQPLNQVRMNQENAPKKCTKENAENAPNVQVRKQQRCRLVKQCAG
jgi:hypothetical protein